MLLNIDNAPNPDFSGWYLEAGRFLTGESRVYDPTSGTFGRLIPNRVFHGGNPFTREGACGALEITGRWSTVGLDSESVSGGEMHDLSLGMNWYTSAASRFMLNLIRSSVRGSGSADIVLLRYQFHP